MKTILASFSLVAFFLLGPASFAAEKKVSQPKQRVHVIVQEPKDQMDNPDAWEPEIIVSSVTSPDQLEKVKEAAYEKKGKREVTAYNRKQAASLGLDREYKKQEYEALQILKAADPAAAFYFLEDQRYMFVIYGHDLLIEEPTSKDYLAFQKKIRELEKQKKPADKMVEEAYEHAKKRAQEIYEAEIEKAKDLLDESRSNPRFKLSVPALMPHSG